MVVFLNLLSETLVEEIQVVANIFRTRGYGGRRCGLKEVVSGKGGEKFFARFQQW